MAFKTVPVFDIAGRLLCLSQELQPLQSINFNTFTGQVNQNATVSGVITVAQLVALGATVPQFVVGLDAGNNVSYSVDATDAIVTSTGVSDVKQSARHLFQTQDGLNVFATMEIDGVLTVPIILAPNARINNIFSDVFVTDLRVGDVTITLNDGGTDATAIGCGIEVEGTGPAIKGAIVMDAGKTGWIFRPFANFAINSVDIIPTGQVTFDITANSTMNQSVGTVGTPTFVAPAVAQTECGGTYTIVQDTTSLILRKDADANPISWEFQPAGGLTILSEIGHESDVGTGLFNIGIANAMGIGTLATDPICFVYNSNAVPVLRLGDTAVFTVSGSITVNAQGLDVSFTTTNTDDDNPASNAFHELMVGGEGGNPGLGDPYMRFYVFGTGGWAVGIDNDDADTLKFRYGVGATPSVGTTRMAVTVGGVLQIDHITNLTGAGVQLDDQAGIDTIGEATADHGVLIDANAIMNIDMGGIGAITLSQAQSRKATLGFITNAGVATFGNGADIVTNLATGTRWIQMIYNNTGGNLTLAQGAVGHTLFRNEGAGDLVLANGQCALCVYVDTGADTYTTFVTVCV